MYVHLPVVRVLTIIDTYHSYTGFPSNEHAPGKAMITLCQAYIMSMIYFGVYDMHAARYSPILRRVIVPLRTDIELLRSALLAPASATFGYPGMLDQSWQFRVAWERQEDDTYRSWWHPWETHSVSAQKKRESLHLRREVNNGP